MNHRIVLMPYLNNRAFFYHQVPKNCELFQLTPIESIRALKQGRAQAGVVPVAGLSQLGDQFEFLGRYGIASNGGPVKSVLFFSHQPFEIFTSANMIKLSGESVTSINLLRLLLGYQQGFDNLPQVVNERDLCDGELVIGDQALLRHQLGDDMHVTDLADKWTCQHQLPFVFARWIINKDAPAELRTSLEDWLSAFVENEIRLQRITAEKEAYRYRMRTQHVVNYLQGIITQIGDRECAGQALYLAELEKHTTDFYQPYYQKRVEGVQYHTIRQN